jgi:hypothetical protein
MFLWYIKSMPFINQKLTTKKHKINEKNCIRVACFFFKIGVELRWSGKLWMVVSFIAYPLCLVSDWLFWIENKGYTLIAEVEKVNLLEVI